MSSVLKKIPKKYRYRGELERAELFQGRTVWNVSIIQTKQRGKKDLCGSPLIQNNELLPHNAQEFFSNWLFVLDDVCSATPLTVSEFLLKCSATFVVTTRSSAVKRFLQKLCPSSPVVRLDAFSDKESWELAKAMTKSKISEENLSLLIKNGRCVFSNLPLAVSIYSLVQASCLRRKDFSEHYRAFSTWIFFKQWKNVERQFGDRFHVRGLSGILEIAQKSLEKRPLVLFLLAKISLCKSEKILWQALIWNKGCTYSLRSVVWIDKSFPGVFVELTKIIDWLFSPQGMENLVRCRSELEELGLISWSEVNGCVEIHSLTLKGVREMLSENHLFMNNLLSCLLTTGEDFSFQLAAKVQSFQSSYVGCCIKLCGFLL